MIQFFIRRWASGLAVVALVLLALAVASSGVVAASKCKRVSGKFTLQAVTGPDCTSSTGICAEGSYSGGLAGSATFTGSSIVPTVDTPTTGVILLTGDNVFQLAGGTLTTKDAIVLRTIAPGDFAEVDTIIGGTGAWAGATGVLRAHGTFFDGSGQGEYTGEICFP